MEEPYQLDTNVSHTQTTMFIKDNQLNEKFQDCLRYELYDLPLQKYLQQKYSWTETTFLSIDWKAHATLIQHHKTQSRESTY